MRILMSFRGYAGRKSRSGNLFSNTGVTLSYMKNFLDSLSPSIVALIQVALTLLYIILFSYGVVTFMPPPDTPDALAPFPPMIFFLTAFVFSALLCGSLVLGYPALLFFEGVRSRALLVILWSVAWFALAFLIATLLFFAAPGNLGI